MDFLLQQTVNGIVLGSAYALYAAGFGLVMANLRVFHVAHAAIFTWGAVLAWILTDQFGWSLLAALPVVAVLAGLLDVLAYLLRAMLEDLTTSAAAAVDGPGSPQRGWPR